MYTVIKAQQLQCKLYSNRLLSQSIAMQTDIKIGHTMQLIAWSPNGVGNHCSINYFGTITSSCSEDDHQLQ